MAYFKIDKKTNIYYDVTGSGETTIIFINGLAMTSKGWFHQTDFFKSSFKVVTYDQRCQGQSSKSTEEFKLSIHTEDLLKLMDFLKIEKAVIAGISYGSIVAKEFAIRSPEKCEKLILISPIYRVDFLLKHSYKIWLNLLEKDMLEEFYMILFFMSFNRPYASSIEKFYKGMYEGFKKYYDSKSIILLLNSIDIENDFTNYPLIKVPSLIIGAKEDKLHNPDDAINISKEIPSSRYELIQGGHAINVENPVEVNQVIKDFLKK